MASAGGATAVPAGTRIDLADTGPAPIANAGPIFNNTLYKPAGGHYGGNFVQLGAPGPPAPYEKTFAAMDGEPIAGTWRAIRN